MPGVIASCDGPGAPSAGPSLIEHGRGVVVFGEDAARSRLDGLSVVGRPARPGSSQAIIGPSDGAAGALDILSRHEGARFVDRDEPPPA